MNQEIGESVAKNTTVMLGAQAITWISSFVLLMFLPRYLGSEDYGRLYLAISMAMIISIIIDFGGNYLIPKEVSKSRKSAPRILLSYIGVRGILWVICMIGLVIFSLIVDYSPLVMTLIIILGVSKLWQGLYKAIKGCFQGFEQMEYPSVGVIAEKIFIALFAVSALLLGAGPVPIAIIMTIGAFINLIICIKFAPKIISYIPDFKVKTSLSLLKSSLPYFLWSIFAVIYYRIDAVMLSTMTTESVVGWYGGAYRFFDVVMFLPSILTTVIFPIFSKLWDDGEEDLHTTFQQSLKFILVAAIPMCLLFFAFAENIIALFYGLEEYGPSVLILQVFAVGIVLVYVDFILGSTILATDKQRPWAVIGFVAVLLNVGLNYLLIPYAQQNWANGAVGAAVTTLLTELFIMGAAFIMLPRQYFKNYDIWIPLKGVAAGLVMAAALWSMNYAGLYWIARAVLALGIYLLVIIYTKVVTPKEITFLKNFFSKKKLKSFLASKKQAYENS